jgi:Mg-chelatase subunit ChlD
LNIRWRFIGAFAVALSLTLVITTLGIANHDIPGWLTHNFAGPIYTVYYATTCGSFGECTPQELVLPADSNGNGTPDAVEEMSGYLEASRTAYVTTYSLLEPNFFGAPRLAYMTGGCWGSYNGHRIAMCAQGTSLDWVQAKSTAVHELFHGTQFGYSSAGSQPTWVIEGQAAFMEDEVFSDLDANAGTFLVSQGNLYLSDPNLFSLTSTGYPIAWFWKYFAEQYGTTPNPGEGMNAIRTFWQRSDTTSTSGISAVNQALATLSPGKTFEEVYKDFVIANYARKLSGPGLLAKYRYTDESESSPGPLMAVKLDVNQAVGPTDQIGPLISYVRAWGARYYVISPSSSVPIISINVQQDTNNRVFYALLTIRAGQIITEQRFVGRNFSRAFANAAYDKVVLVVAGLDNYANYRLGINANQPILNIVDPLNGRAAQVTAGSPSVRDTFMIKADVLDTLGNPVPGIPTNAFTVTVGTAVVPVADLVTSAYIQGQYWLLVRAPALSAGYKNLRVQWASLSDTETNAVNYTTRIASDNILVIDRSGSMLGTKLTAAQNAGRLYIDSWPDGDQVGLVSFATTPSPDFPLQPLDSTSRPLARNAVDLLSAGGSTTIGGGALTALNQLTTTGSTTSGWAVVLLSDGQENTAPWVSNFLDRYNAMKDAGQKVPVVHTVSLGQDADRAAMQNIATATGGAYFFVAEPGALLPGTSLPTSGSLELDMADVYRSVAETVDIEQQIYSEQHALDPQLGPLDVPIQVDAQAAEAFFTMNWLKSYAPGSVKLLDPDGIDYAYSFFDLTHNFWRIPDPTAGVWHMKIDCSNVKSCATTYLVEAALKSPVEMHLYFNPAPDQRQHGLPVDIIVGLNDMEPILGAAVDVKVTAPGGTVYSLTLYDDGSHGDGEAGDGLYGNHFYQTFWGGTYVVKAHATGTSNLGSPFVRRIQRAFEVIGKQGDDSDQDGLPDAWEIFYGTNPKVPDEKTDPDQDGCTSLTEYSNGSNPLDADTDDGGENDCSEISGKKDLFDPLNDSIHTTSELYGAAGVGQNLLGLPLLPGIDHWILYRSTDPDSGYQLLNSQVPVSDTYKDPGLLNDQTYFYKLEGVSPGGAVSSPSDPLSLTPKLDPLPPGGAVFINNGQSTTTSQSVTLTLQAVDDGAVHTPGALGQFLEQFEASPGLSPKGINLEMRISNSPAFTGADWQPFVDSLPWHLDASNGAAIVYVQFRDASGNLSPVVTDYIFFLNNPIYLPLINRQ